MLINSTLAWKYTVLIVCTCMFWEPKWGKQQGRCGSRLMIDATYICRKVFGDCKNSLLSLQPPNWWVQGLPICFSLMLLWNIESRERWSSTSCQPGWKVGWRETHRLYTGQLSVRETKGRHLGLEIGRCVLQKNPFSCQKKMCSFSI